MGPDQLGDEADTHEQGVAHQVDFPAEGQNPKYQKSAQNATLSNGFHGGLSVNRSWTLWQIWVPNRGEVSINVLFFLHHNILNREVPEPRDPFSSFGGHFVKVSFSRRQSVTFTSKNSKKN